jgi:hypothetical protein
MKLIKFIIRAYIRGFIFFFMVGAWYAGRNMFIFQLSLLLMLCLISKRFRKFITFGLWKEVTSHVDTKNKRSK